MIEMPGIRPSRLLSIAKNVANLHSQLNRPISPELAANIGQVLSDVEKAVLPMEALLYGQRPADPLATETNVVALRVSPGVFNDET